MHKKLSYLNCLKETMRDDYIKNVKTKIKEFSDFLGDKHWFTGSEVYVYKPSSKWIQCSP